MPSSMSERVFQEKDSSWILGIPKIWRKQKLKYIFFLVNDKVESKQSTQRYLGMECVESWSGRILDAETDAEGLACRFIEGDILFGKLRPYLAKVTIAPFKGICSTEFLVYRVLSGKTDYYRYVLASAGFIDLINSSTYGAKMPRANPAFIGNQLLPVPPVGVQTAIATFLDRKTTQIDQAVAIKEKQIALLKDRKQILIQNAVTRGLNPDASMRDSGVEWIGEIPAHWELRRVKTVFRLVMQPAEKNNDHELLSIYTDIGVKPRRELEERGNKASTTDGYWLVEKGDIIVNKLLAWMGAIGVSDYEGVTSPAYDILRAIRPINPHFYHLLFRSEICSQELKKHSRGIMDMRLRLYFDKFGNVFVPYPSKEEQDAIVTHIETQSSKIDQAITLQQQQIERLKEYKATLINSAVTGKIKVPEVVEDGSEAVA